ncbi:unnamed protein product [Caenorhabditis angaria]|uniref:Uncharacterized protein n=1 Tax=Caenorhabditis angaria TaxID=860376 RepID=A0A9P1J5Y4_9PELO|nr:unnamed protein product [Caenorhabditis angaria]
MDRQKDSRMDLDENGEGEEESPRFLQKIRDLAMVAYKTQENYRKTTIPSNVFKRPSDTRFGENRQLFMPNGLYKGLPYIAKSKKELWMEPAVFMETVLNPKVREGVEVERFVFNLETEDFELKKTRKFTEDDIDSGIIAQVLTDLTTITRNEVQIYLGEKPQVQQPLMNENYPIDRETMQLLMNPVLPYSVSSVVSSNEIPGPSSVKFQKFSRDYSPKTLQIGGQKRRASNNRKGFGPVLKKAKSSEEATSRKKKNGSQDGI